MTTVTALPWSRPLTYADLEGMPDDGHRYELLDGMLLVSPSPGDPHQGVVGSLHMLLRSACPPDLAVRLGPFDVQLAEDTVLIPDLSVARRVDLTPKNLPVAPLLAVEVLSPSTRLYDLNLKKARYEQAGVASYWVVDPLRVTFTAWELLSGQYVKVADVSAGESVTLSSPYQVTLDPGALLD